MTESLIQKLVLTTTDLDGVVALRGQIPKAALDPVGGMITTGDGAFALVSVFPQSSTAEEIQGSGVFPKNAEELVTWIDIGVAQYLRNIAPETLLDRSEDYLADELKVKNRSKSKATFSEIFSKVGLAPFMTLENATIFVDRQLACYDFECRLDQYLFDYGFSLILRDNIVEFVIVDISFDVVEVN